jgi:hypothetical protein
MHHKYVEFLDFAFKLWGSVVETYTRTQLTYPTDRLIAISGLASRFRGSLLSYLGTLHGLENPNFLHLREILGTEFDHSLSSLYSDDDAKHNHRGGYIAGVWMLEITSQLLWQIVQAPTQQTSQPYIAPSWSWAALNTEVSGAYKKKLHDSFDIVSVLSCSATSVKIDDPFGSVLDGSLVLEGKLVQWRRSSLMCVFEKYLLLFWDIKPVADNHKEDGVFYLLPIRVDGSNAFMRALARVKLRIESMAHNWGYEYYIDRLSALQIPENDCYGLEGIILKETHPDSKGQDGISMTFKRVGQWGQRTNMEDIENEALQNIVSGVQYMDNKPSASAAEDAILGKDLWNIFKNGKTHKITIL